MAWLSDAVKEFKKLPTPGKIAILALFVAVAGIGYYEYAKSKNTAAGVANSTGGAAGTTDTTGAAGGYFPSTNVNGNNIPIIPPGYSAIFDSLGNLIGYQQNPTQTPSPTPNPTPTPNPNPNGCKPGVFYIPGSPCYNGPNHTLKTPPYIPHFSNEPPNAGSSPLIPFGTKGIPNVLGAHYTYGGTNFTIVPGSNGRIWGVPGNLTGAQAKNTPAKLLLYGPQNEYATGGMASLSPSITPPTGTARGATMGLNAPIRTVPSNFRGSNISTHTPPAPPVPVSDKYVKR